MVHHGDASVVGFSGHGAYLQQTIQKRQSIPWSIEQLLNRFKLSPGQTFK
jgi:hypothetical protein